MSFKDGETMLTELKRAVELHLPLRLNFFSLLFISWLGIFSTNRLTVLSPENILEYLPLFCPFETITEIASPGCGMTRAFLALAEGDFFSAFHYNPFSIPFFAFTVFSAFDIRLSVSEKFKTLFYSVLLFIILSWWVWTRLIPGVAAAVKS